MLELARARHHALWADALRFSDGRPVPTEDKMPQ